MNLIFLYLIFFKIGLFTIGGGLAALPLLQSEALARHWFTGAEFFNMVAISESTPGPIGVNMATYVGLEHAGIPGSLAATFGLVSPSVIIILLVARYFFHFNEKPVVQSALSGLRPAVTGLIGTAAFNVLIVSVFTLDQYLESRQWLDLVEMPALILFFLIGAAHLKWQKLHPVIFITAAAVGGVLVL